MKSIKLFLKPHRWSPIPLAHFTIAQAMLYNIINQADDSVSDLIHGSNNIKMLSFSDFNGISNINKETKTITYSGTVEWEIRSAFDDFIDLIERSVLQNSVISLGDNLCKVVSYSISRKSFLTDEFSFRMNTPLTVYITDEQRHTKYFSPEEKNLFQNAVKNNLIHKYELLYNEDFDGKISFYQISDNPRKVVTKYKNTIVNGYYGVYGLKADKEILEIAYYTGIGAKNSAGFGFVEDK